MASPSIPDEGPPDSGASDEAPDPRARIRETFRRRVLPWLRHRGPVLLLVALVGLTLGVRLLRSHHGLPYLDHWDEPTLANRALLMLESGELDPGYFQYPSLLLYLSLGVDAAHFLRLASLPEDHPDSLTSLDELEVGEPGADWFVSHPSFYVWNRWLVSLFGTATVVAAALFAASMAPGLAAPILAVLLLGTLRMHVWHSSVVTTDVPAACLAAFAILYCLRFERRQRPGELVVAAALAGLAASTKYNLGTVALFVLACLALALWRRSAGHRAWLWPALPATTGVAFLAGTPYALLDLRTFLDDVAYEIHHYVVAGHGTSSATPGWPHLRLDVAELAQHLGSIPLAVAVLGLGLCLRRPGGWLLVVPPLLQLVLTTRTTVHFHRNLLLLYPFLAAGFGVGVVAIVDALRPRLRALRWRMGVAVAAGVLVTVWGVLATKDALIMGWRARERQDARSRAIEGLERFYPQHEAWMASELRWHPRDLERLDLPYRLLPTLEVLCRPRPPRTLAVTGAEYRYLVPGSEAEEATLNAAVGDLSTARTLGSGPTWVDRYTVDPRIAIWDDPTAGEREVCRILSRPRLVEGTAGRADGAGLWLPAGELVATAPTPIYPAPYALTWNEKDLTGARVVLEVEVLFTPAGGAETRAVAGRHYRTRPSGRDRQLPFRIEEPGTVALRFQVAGARSGEAVWVRELGFAFRSDGPPPRR